MKTLILPLLVLTLAAGCGRLGDSASRLNPFGSSGSTRGVATLAPDGGYRAAEARPSIARITGASWQPLNEGRLLVVTGIAPTKGYWRAALVADTPDPTGRLRPGPDGVLHLRMVAEPPPPGTQAAATPASAATDTITTAVTLSNATLAGLRQVVISGAGNTVTLNR